VISDIKQVSGDTGRSQVIACWSQMSSNSMLDITTIYLNTGK